MKVTILFRDGRIEVHENFFRCSNASAKIPNDWFYVWRYGDDPGKPTYRYPMADISCVEVAPIGYRG